MLSKYRRHRRPSKGESLRFIAACRRIYRSLMDLLFSGEQSPAWVLRCSLHAALASMLKVTTKEGAASLTFVLEGRLCRPWTAEAERGWTKLISTAGDKKVALDLSGLTFVDGDGEALLGMMMESGTQVRARGVLVSHLVAQVQKRMQRKSKRFSRGAPRPRPDPGAP